MTEISNEDRIRKALETRQDRLGVDLSYDEQHTIIAKAQRELDTRRFQGEEITYNQAQQYIQERLREAKNKKNTVNQEKAPRFIRRILDIFSKKTDR